MLEIDWSRKDNPTNAVAFRIGSEYFNKLHELAEEHDISVSLVCKKIISQYIDDMEGEKNGK